MYGRYDIIVETKRLRYELTVQRKYTVIRGNSGTGKSELYRTLSRAPFGGVRVECAVKLLPLDATSIMSDIPRKNKGGIIVIDEDDINTVGVSKLVSIMKESDNYFILITRRKLSELSVEVAYVKGICRT